MRYAVAIKMHEWHLKFIPFDRNKMTPETQSIAL